MSLRLSELITECVYTIIFPVSLIVSLPFAIFFKTEPADPGDYPGAEDCKEVWPEPNHVYKKASIIVVVFTTYVVPLAVIIFCYARILKTLWNKRLASGVSCRGSHILYG